MIKQTKTVQNLKAKDFVKFAGGWYQVKDISLFSGGTVVELQLTRIDTKADVAIEVTLSPNTMVTFKRPRF